LALVRLSAFRAALERYPDFVRRRGILSTITSLNDRHLLPIARRFRELGLSSWNWSLFQPIGQGRDRAAQLDFSVDRLLESWHGGAEQRGPDDARRAAGPGRAALGPAGPDPRQPDPVSRAAGRRAQAPIWGKSWMKYTWLKVGG